MDISSIAGKDTPVEYNEKGAGQSHVPARFDLVDGKAMFAMAAVLHEGAVKYGANNWRGISIDDHLNHLIMHAYAYLAGDRSDEHLSHIMCRAMFAQAVEITDKEKEEPVSDTTKPVISYDGFMFASVTDLVEHIERKTNYGSDLEIMTRPIVKVNLEKIININEDKS